MNSEKSLLYSGSIFSSSQTSVAQVWPKTLWASVDRGADGVLLPAEMLVAFETKCVVQLILTCQCSLFSLKFKEQCATSLNKGPAVTLILLFD